MPPIGNGDNWGACGPAAVGWKADIRPHGFRDIHRNVGHPQSIIKNGGWIMDRRTFIGAGAILPAAGLASPAARAQTSSLRDQILGAWRILDAEKVNVTTGTTAPWLGRPRPYSGVIIYLPSGMMAVQIAAAREPSRPGAGLLNLSNGEKIDLLDTYYAYHGRFEVDEVQSKIRHFVDHALFESETGATLVRTVSLSGGVLTLSTDNLLAGPDGATFNRLTWARV